MTEQFWADAATKNCVWLFQTRRQEWSKEKDCLIDYWHTERVLLTCREADVHGTRSPYEWGEKDKGWRIWGTPCEGQMARILGQHSREFAADVPLNLRSRVWVTLTGEELVRFRKHDMTVEVSLLTTLKELPLRISLMVIRTHPCIKPLSHRHARIYYRQYHFCVINQ
jgi:hypothetical protein